MREWGCIMKYVRILYTSFKIQNTDSSKRRVLQVKDENVFDFIKSKLEEKILVEMLLIRLKEKRKNSRGKCSPRRQDWPGGGKT